MKLKERKQPVNNRAKLDGLLIRNTTKIIRDNLLTNSKAILDDLRQAEHIFGGTAVDLLKGKTVYKPVNTHASIERVTA